MFIKPIKNLSKILIVRTDRMGDVVLTTPTFKALRLAYPQAFIAILVTPFTQDIVQGNPYIDEILVDDRKGRHKGFIGFLQFARLLRRHEFDAAFIFHTKRRYNLACFIAGILTRIGYKNDKWGFLLTHPVLDTRALGVKHEVDYCLDLLRAVGIDHKNPEICIPNQKDAELFAQQLFDKELLVEGQVIAIHAGASDATKIWPAKMFAQLINSLHQRYLFKIILIGGVESISIVNEVKQGIQGSVIDVTGKISVGQMASVLKRCRMLISNDSGPVHVASGVGIDVISLFLRNQPGINAERWAPYGPLGHIISNKPEVAVHLDEKSRLQKGKLDAITTEEVLDVVERILRAEHQPVFYW